MLSERRVSCVPRTDEEMIRHNAENVLAAFETLLEELEGALRDITKAGADGFGAQDYDLAQGALEDARSVTVFREKVALLKKEWQELETALPASPSEGTAKVVAVAPPTRKRSNSSKHQRPALPERPAPVGRLIVGRIRKGLRTPESAFFLPILQTLVDLGGAAKRQEVYEVVVRVMDGVLKPIDFQPLASGARQLRWQNSAQWAHNLLVKEGLLKWDSPNGIWEVTEQGRHFLAEQKRQER